MLTVDLDLDLLAARGKASLGSFGPLRDIDGGEALGEESTVSIAVKTNHQISSSWQIIN